MALNNGNMVRGNALMTMAARDGDTRATRYMATLEYSNRVKASHIPQSINKSALEPEHAEKVVAYGKLTISARKYRGGENTPDSNMVLVKDATASPQVVN